jgi:two-component system, NarL family, nitrate/nitrite response regulator NarL
VAARHASGVDQVRKVGEDVVMSPLRKELSVTLRSSQRRAREAATPAPRGAARVLVVDADLLTAEAIVFSLTQMKFAVRFVSPVTAPNVRELVGWDPELALLDIDTVDEATCLEVITTLREAGVPVAVVGGQAGEYLLARCVQAGATSVIAKSSSLDELVQTVTRLLAREVLLGEDDRRQLAEPYWRAARDRRARLSPFDVLTHREKCVLAELMEGYGAEMIARRASVSVSTVRTQIKAILQKLGVNSQLAAAGLARRAGWSYDDRATGTDGGPAAPASIPA